MKKLAQNPVPHLSNSIDESKCSLISLSSLLVSLLTFWNPSTTGPVSIESVPTNAAEGKDVLLVVHNLPGNLLGYVWYKGDRVEPKLQIVSYIINTSEITPGTVYSGREKIYADGSLLFHNATPGDTGYYTLQVIKKTLLTEVGTGQLHENKDPMVLTCFTNNTRISIQWFFNDQSLLLTERMKLSQDNSTLTIDSHRRGNTWDYQCEFSNLISSSKGYLLSWM
ncbi:cell adhesion molecule CEACAM6-like [Equus asinus]|uniref:cell adhesion molecule CEACAM6-like n=1 Tax=Equus asinus TaxID=9793 RepID=UPI0038F6FBAC